MLRSCCAAVILSSLNCRIRARPAPRALSSPQPLFRSARVHAPQEDPLMLGTEHPPSTTRSPRLARRALTPPCAADGAIAPPLRSEENTHELQSLMRTHYAVFLSKKNN